MSLKAKPPSNTGRPLPTTVVEPKEEDPNTAIQNEIQKPMQSYQFYLLQNILFIQAQILMKSVAVTFGLQLKNRRYSWIVLLEH